MKKIIEDDFMQRVKSILKTSHFSLGIGDIADATGVSQRQLRYWEKKGYIKPSTGTEEGKHRKYSYFTLAKVSLIQSFIETGFTLNAAVAKADEHREVANALKQLVINRLSSVETLDNGFKFNLGPIEGLPGKDLIATIHTGQDTTFTLENQPS